jgi:acetoacetate decarboxylase
LVDIAGSPAWPQNYPPPPWRLAGHGACWLRLVAIDQARELVPDRYSLVSVLPGRTLGAIYLASYQAGSTLEYRELIVVPALVHYRGRRGAWISHIYVDDERSVAGGREIWGLPKELAQFQDDADGSLSVTVRQGAQVLCHLRASAGLPVLPAPVFAPAFGERGGQTLWLRGRGSARLTPCRGGIEIPADSPFASFHGRSLGTFRFRGLDGTVDAPTVL